MCLHVDPVLKGSPPRAFDNNHHELVDRENKESQKYCGAMCVRSGLE
jgi:hypothetical protein